MCCMDLLIFFCIKLTLKMITSWLWLLGFEIDYLKWKMCEKTLVKEKTIICTPNLYKHFLSIHVAFRAFFSNFFLALFFNSHLHNGLTTFFWGEIWLGSQDNFFFFSFWLCLISSTSILSHVLNSQKRF
jgi:hypothetical protein